VGAEPTRARTLGDLLYADAKPVAAEKDWSDLLRAVGAGDQRALRLLYDHSHRLVYTLAVRITGDRHVAEEVTLDVFHQVWRRAATYDASGGSVLGWIMNQARSRAIDRARFEHRQKRVHPAPTAPVDGGEVRDPLATLDLKDRGRVLREALDVLTPDERRAIETAFFSELTYREVAAHLQQPVGTIKTRIRSALGKLRQALTAMKDP
jgi:RNA polymerase sigma-70 factor (ECF subfamily)